MFSFQNLYKAGKLCCKGVGWKGSTQRYLGDIISNTAKTRKALLEGKTVRKVIVRAPNLVNIVAG